MQRPNNRFTPCSIDGCDGNASSSQRGGKGYCSRHYRRLLKNGHPEGGRRTMNGDPRRFYEEVALKYEGDECIQWPFGAGGRGRGYGRMHTPDGPISVHRALCEAAHGPPPTPEHEAAHSCGNGHLRCVTKRHLSWKTPKENAADRLIHGTHSAGEKNGNARLTEAQVREILAIRGTTTQASIARRYGVTPQTIHEIYKGKTWACLQEGNAR